MEWLFYDIREVEKWENNWKDFCEEYGIKYRIFAKIGSGRETFKVVLEL